MIRYLMRAQIDFAGVHDFEATRAYGIGCCSKAGNALAVMLLDSLWTHGYINLGSNRLAARSAEHEST